MSKASEALDRNWESAKNDLVAAADTAGIDPAIMAKMAGLGSAYDATARPISRDPNRNKVTQYDGVNAISSAHGYGQLTNDTWTTMLQRYGEKYGVEGAAKLTSAEANTAKYREDRTLQAGMFAELTRENIAAVAGKGGDDVSTNIYAYHNLGQGTGAVFLNAVKNNPDVRVDTVLSKDVIKGNSALYGDGSISVSAAYQKMTDTLAIYDKYAQEVQHTPERNQNSPNTNEDLLRGVSNRHTLKQGDRGDSVGELQKQLNSLGYTDTRGAPLSADKDFGVATKAAVEAFQQDNDLTPDGIVGPATQKAIGEQLKLQEQEPQQQVPTRLDNPDHPDNPLFQQARTHVHRLDEQLGRTPDQLSDNIASALAVSVRANGLQRIDQIALSDDGSRLWAVQRPEGMRYAFLDSHASVPTSSVNTTMEQSGAQWPQAMQQFQQHQEQAMTRQQELQAQQQTAQQAVTGPISPSR